MLEENKELIETELIDIKDGFKMGLIKEEDLMHRKEEITSYIEHYRKFPDYDIELANTIENLLNGCKATREILKTKK